MAEVDRRFGQYDEADVHAVVLVRRTPAGAVRQLARWPGRRLRKGGRWLRARGTPGARRYIDI